MGAPSKRPVGEPFYYDDMKGRLTKRVIVNAAGCWEWQGQIRGGYGRIVIGMVAPGAGRKQIVRSTHRLAYELFVGPVPTGLHLDHLCRNRCCCNPEHLEPVTQQENIRRGDVGVVAKARAAAQTHCYKGHELAGDNLVLQGPEKRYRVCRTCRAERQRQRYQPKETS